MSFLRPASPNPLQRASSPMEGSPMDFSSPPGISTSGNNPYTTMNPLSRVAQSPTAAHLRNRTRRPSSLSIALDRTKSFTGFPSPSNISGGGSSSSGSLGGNGNGNAGSMLQPAATIQEYGSGDIAGRGRASSSASSMSIGLSPARRNTSLDEVGLEANEETPNARRQTGFGAQVAKMKRYRQIMGMSGPNGSESDLSTASNGRTTPDLVNQRGLEDDVDALAVAPDHSVHSSPMKDSSPAKSAEPLSPFSLKGPLKPARLLRVQNELNAPFLDSETKSEAAFSRLVQSTSDLASRLRLTISNAGSSPARKRQTRNWMGEWAASNVNTEPKHWAGRFPESVEGDGELPSPDTESDGSDHAADTTLVASRPSSVMGQAPIGIPIQGRSRSGSTMTANGDMMLVGSYGGNEQGEGLAGMMDLDMASNMSSPVSTPLTTNWREPAPFFQSKKRKFSVTADQDKIEYQPQAKKRKGLSPYGAPMTLQAGTSSPLSNSGSGSFVFPPPKSPLHLNGASLQLSMTAMPNASLGSFGFPNNNNNGVHQHRKSGSISMAWSRPGSAHSSPLLRPTSSHSNMPAPPSGMLLGPTLLSNSTTATPSENGDGFNFTFSSSNGRNMAGAAINQGTGENFGHGGAPQMTQGGVQQGFPSYTPGAQLGQYGAPVTSSPSARPMMKLPTRALGANGVGFGFGAISHPPSLPAGTQQPRLDGGVVGLSLNP